MKMFLLLIKQYSKSFIREAFIILLTFFIVLLLLEAVSPLSYAISLTNSVKKILPANTAYFFPYDRMTQISVLSSWLQRNFPTMHYHPASRHAKNSDAVRTVANNPITAFDVYWLPLSLWNIHPSFISCLASIASIVFITSSFVILSAIWSPSTSPVTISLITQ